MTQSNSSVSLYDVLMSFICVSAWEYLSTYYYNKVPWLEHIY